MSNQMYPEEILDDDYDDGTMPASLEALQKAVIGRRIISAERKSNPEYPWRGEELVLTLDDGHQVVLEELGDCCAYTEIEEFLLHPESVDHMILGVGTTGEYTSWHIYADFGDIMKLKVGWSCGNPFYYGYGFDIRVQEIPSNE